MVKKTINYPKKTNDDNMKNIFFYILILLRNK